MRIPAAWLLPFLLSACALVPTHLQTPDISFLGVRAMEASLFEQRLEVRLRVSNPNDIELPVNGLDVSMRVADEPFAHGVSAREFTVPARGDAEFDMVVTANAANVLWKLANADRETREAIPYRLEGKLSTRLGMLRSIPFTESGTVPLADLTGKKHKAD